MNQSPTVNAIADALAEVQAYSADVDDDSRDAVRLLLERLELDGADD